MNTFLFKANLRLYNIRPHAICLFFVLAFLIPFVYLLFLFNSLPIDPELALLSVTAIEGDREVSPGTILLTGEPVRFDLVFNRKLDPKELKDKVIRFQGDSDIANPQPIEQAKGNGASDFSVSVVVVPAKPGLFQVGLKPFAKIRSIYGTEIEVPEGVLDPEKWRVDTDRLKLISFRCNSTRVPPETNLIYHLEFDREVKPESITTSSFENVASEKPAEFQINKVKKSGERSFSVEMTPKLSESEIKGFIRLGFKKNIQFQNPDGKPIAYRGPLASDQNLEVLNNLGPGKPSLPKTTIITLKAIEDEAEVGKPFHYLLESTVPLDKNCLKSEYFRNAERATGNFTITNILESGNGLSLELISKEPGKFRLEISTSIQLASKSTQEKFFIEKGPADRKIVEIWAPLTWMVNSKPTEVMVGDPISYQIVFDPPLDNKTPLLLALKNKNDNPKLLFSNLSNANGEWNFSAVATEPGKVQLVLDKSFVGHSPEGVLLKSKDSLVDKKVVEVQSARLDIKGKMLLVIADTKFFRANGPRFARLLGLAKGDFHPDPIFILKANGQLTPWDGSITSTDAPWAPEDLAKAWSSVSQAISRQTKKPGLGTFLLWPDSTNQDTTKLAEVKSPNQRKLLGLIGNPNKVSGELEKQLPIGDLLDLRTDWQAMAGSIELQLAK